MAPSVKLEVGQDLELLAETMRGWELELCPLGPPSGPSEVSAAGAEGFLANYVKIGAATRQSGAAPRGLRTFGLPEGNGEVTRWCGQSVGSRHLPLFEPSGSFEATALAGFGALICSVSEDRLAAACAELGLPEPERLLGSTAQVLDCGRGALDPPRLLVQQLLGAAEAGTPDLLDHALREITSLLVQAAATGRELKTRIDPLRSRRVLDQALAAVHDEPHSTHSVRALCNRTHASERTLRHAFQQRFGVAPRTYLRSIRLNGARRELRDADPSVETVTRVAQRWSFSNAGDFAAHYTRLFGERPSETLRRPARG